MNSVVHLAGRLAARVESGHYVSVGTFGLDAHTFPGGDQSAGSGRKTDWGVDVEYQYIVRRHNVTVLATWIREDQRVPPPV